MTSGMLVMIAALTLAQSAAPPGVHVWTAEEIAKKGRELGTRLDAQKVASEVISTEGNRTFMIAHREGSGVAEWHEKQADILYITSGDITIHYGGELVDAKTTAPGEQRAPSIKGGTTTRMKAGDIIHIPAKVPHQMMLAPGAQVTYFVTKVVE